MTAAALLDDVRKRGGDLVPMGATLRYRGPRLAAADPLRAEIAEHRSALLLKLEAEQAHAALEAIAAEIHRRATRALELEQLDSDEDRFVAGHHRSEARLMVTDRWLPAIQAWARLEHQLGRLPVDLAHLMDDAGQGDDQ